VEYWDRLLTVTNCSGIHFADFPELKDFTCPEWSHLKHSDAIAYTKGLAKILKQQNWFTNNN
jgi:hypothetical protein